MKRRPLFIWPLISPTMWAWGARMLMNCTEERYAINKARMVRISNYSAYFVTRNRDMQLEFIERAECHA